MKDEPPNSFHKPAALAPPTAPPTATPTVGEKEPQDQASEKVGVATDMVTLQVLVSHPSSPCRPPAPPLPPLLRLNPLPRSSNLAPASPPKPRPLARPLRATSRLQLQQPWPLQQSRHGSVGGVSGRGQWGSSGVRTPVTAPLPPPPPCSSPLLPSLLPPAPGECRGAKDQVAGGSAGGDPDEETGDQAPVLRGAGGHHGSREGVGEGEGGRESVRGEGGREGGRVDWKRIEFSMYIIDCLSEIADMA